MISCSVDKDILILAANKELSWGKRISVLKHIRKCEDCRKLFLEYKNISQLIKKMPEYECSEELTKSIENKIGIKSSQPSVYVDLLSVIFFSRVKFIGIIVTIFVIFSVILFRDRYPELDKSKTDEYYSAAEVNSANVKAKQALAILGKFIDKTQVQIGSEILEKKVSEPMNKGINTVTEIFNKGDKNESN